MYAHAHTNQNPFFPRKITPASPGPTTASHASKNNDPIPIPLRSTRPMIPRRNNPSCSGSFDPETSLKTGENSVHVVGVDQGKRLVAYVLGDFHDVLRGSSIVGAANPHSLTERLRECNALQRPVCHEQVESPRLQSCHRTSRIMNISSPTITEETQCPI